MLVVSIIASILVVSQGSWFNGQSGLAAIPKPFQAGRLSTSSATAGSTSR